MFQVIAIGVACLASGGALVGQAVESDKITKDKKKLLEETTEEETDIELGNADRDASKLYLG